MVNYCEITVGGCREEYIVYCNGNESSGLGWFQMGWVKRGTCPLWWGEESAIHILQNCQETQKWKEKFLGIKWLQMNEVTVEETCKALQNYGSEAVRHIFI